MQTKHPAAAFFKSNAYNAFDDDGNLVVEGESVYAYLDTKAKPAVDRTIDAYTEALKAGSPEVDAPREELEVLVSMLIVKDNSFHEEAVERFKTVHGLDDLLARQGVVKLAADRTS